MRLFDFPCPFLQKYTGSHSVSFSIHQALICLPFTCYSTVAIGQGDSLFSLSLFLFHPPSLISHFYCHIWSLSIAVYIYHHSTYPPFMSPSCLFSNSCRLCNPERISPSLIRGTSAAMPLSTEHTAMDHWSFTSNPISI